MATKTAREIFIETLQRKAYRKVLVGKKPNKEGKMVNVYKNEPATPELVTLQKNVSTGAIKLQDATIIVTKYVSGEQTVQMFEEGKARTRGLVSIANSKLLSGQFFCPTAIGVLAANCDSNSDVDVQSAIYSQIDGKKVIGSGEFTFKVNENEELLKEEQLSKYVGVDLQNLPKGTHPIANTTIIHPEKRMFLDVSFPTTVPAADKIAIRFVIHGAITAPKAQ
ncbi:MAG: hypothetical protein U0V72_00635 [Cytophagales bacterium]